LSFFKISEQTLKLCAHKMTARTNKAFETGKEMLITIAGTFVFLCATAFFADIYPINLLMVAIFSDFALDCIGCFFYRQQRRLSAPRGRRPTVRCERRRCYAKTGGGRTTRKMTEMIRDLTEKSVLSVQSVSKEWHGLTLRKPYAGSAGSG